jgi:hypothetical protein
VFLTQKKLAQGLSWLEIILEHIRANGRIGGQLPLAFVVLDSGT